MVPSYMRTLSKTQYVYESVMLRKLVASTIVNKFSKKYTFYGLQSTFKLIDRVMQCCVLANQCDLTTAFEKRRELLTEALHTLNLFSIEFECILEYNNMITDGVLDKIFEKTDYLEKLIKGVINSDRKRVSK